LHSDEPQTGNQDSTVRRYLLSRSPNPVATPSRCPASYSLALQLSARYFQAKKIAIAIQADQWQFGSTLVRRLTRHSGGYQNLDDRGNQSLIRYRRTLNPQQIARQITFRDVLRNTREFRSDLVAERVVLVGITAPSIPDLHNTPYGRLRGLQVHAHSVSQLLSAVEDQRRLIHWLPFWGDAIWVLSWSIVGGLILWRFRRLSDQGLALGSAVLVLYGCCWLAFAQSLWIPFVPSTIALLLTSGTIAIANQITTKGLLIHPEV
jgi:CHASE2 domain-containing sensor protein